MLKCFGNLVIVLLCLNSMDCKAWGPTDAAGAKEASGKARTPGEGGSVSVEATRPPAERTTDPSASPGPSPTVNSLQAKLAEVPADASEATLLKLLGTEGLSKLNSEDIPPDPPDRKARLTKLVEAAKKSPEQLTQYWKEYKTRMGENVEGKAVRAVLDQRMKDFPGLDEIYSKSGGTKEELYQKLTELKGELGREAMGNPTRRNAAIDRLSQIISATGTNERNKLQTELAKKLNDPKIGSDEKRLLQGLDLALKMERGSASDTREGLPKVDGAVLTKLQSHPFISDGKPEFRAAVIGDFETSRNSEQVRIKNYWDAVATVKNPEKKSGNEINDATDLLKAYGDTSSWHARQFSLSGGKDSSHRDAVVAVGKASGTIDTEGFLHAMSTNHTNGKPFSADFNLLRDQKGLNHHIINTKDPAVLEAYLKARGEQNDGGGYHADVARKAREDHEQLRAIVSAEGPTELREDDINFHTERIAKERAMRNLGISTIPRETEWRAVFEQAVEDEKKKIAEQTKIGARDTGGLLSWKPYDYKIPPIVPSRPTVATAPPVVVRPKLEVDPATLVRRPASEDDTTEIPFPSWWPALKD